MGYFLNSIEQNAQTLSSFGLTVKQAKVYLGLVFLGTAAVGEISKISNVRREEVYRILPKLEKMGLIEKTLSTPVKLKATSVENALSILIQNEEENAKNRIIELRKIKEEFLLHFRTSSKEVKNGDNEQFSLTSEKAVSLGKTDSLIAAAQTQIDLVASREKVLQFIRFFSKDSLKKAISRGVKFRIISNPPTEVDELRLAVNQLFENQKNISIRYLGSLPNHFLVMDNKEVLIATSTSGYLADNPILWSNNMPHVTVYKKLFEDLWDSSVELVSLNLDKVERLNRFYSRIKPAQHLVFMFENAEAKFLVLLNYIKHGLDNGEACLYVCSESSVEEATDAMKQCGFNLNKYQKSGALQIVDYTQHYLIDGCFNIEATSKLCKAYYDEALHKGFKGLRVASEMSCFFKHNLTTELVDYEQSLHIISQPITAMYAYRADQLMLPNQSINVYSKIVKMHRNVLFSWIDSKLGRVAIS